MLLSLFFSATSKTSADRVASLAIFLALLAVIGLALGRVRSWRAWSGCSTGWKTAAPSCAFGPRSPWRSASACWPTDSGSPRYSARSPPACWYG